MRRHVAVLFPCLLAVVACGAFGSESPVDADAGTDPGADATPDRAQPDAAPPSDGGACAHLRCLTFEEGLLGFDQTMGAPTLAMSDAPKGKRALSVDGSGTTYIVVETGMRAELWLSFYVRLRKPTGVDAAPFSILAADGTALATGAFIGTTLSVDYSTGRSLLTNAFATDSVYRVGIHVKQGGGGSGLLVEGFFASGDAPFGSFKFSATENLNNKSPARIHIGTTTKTNLNGIFDDIFVSETAMPAPSP